MNHKTDTKIYIHNPPYNIMYELFQDYKWVTDGVNRTDITMAKKKTHTHTKHKTKENK